MRTASNKYSNIVIGVLLQRLSHHLGTDLSFCFYTGTEYRVNREFALPGLCIYRNRGGIRHGTINRIIPFRQYLGKNLVKPVDQLFSGTKISPQQERFEVYRANALGSGQQELTNLRIAKTIDGLHRVAHTKQGSSIARLPATGQCFKHPVLGTGRILHFIHKDMLHLVVQQERYVARVVRIAQCITGTHCDLNVVSDAASKTQTTQLGNGQWQQPKQGYENGPLSFAVGRGRQFAYRR